MEAVWIILIIVACIAGLVEVARLLDIGTGGVRPEDKDTRRISGEWSSGD